MWGGPEFDDVRLHTAWTDEEGVSFCFNGHGGINEVFIADKRLKKTERAASRACEASAADGERASGAGDEARPWMELFTVHFIFAGACFYTSGWRATLRAEWGGGNGGDPSSQGFSFFLFFLQPLMMATWALAFLITHPGLTEPHKAAEWRWNKNRTAPREGRPPNPAPPPDRREKTLLGRRKRRRGRLWKKQSDCSHARRAKWAEPLPAAAKHSTFLSSRSFKLSGGFLWQDFKKNKQTANLRSRAGEHYRFTTEICRLESESSSV